MICPATSGNNSYNSDKNSLFNCPVSFSSNSFRRLYILLILSVAFPNVSIWALKSLVLSVASSVAVISLSITIAKSSISELDDFATTPAFSRASIKSSYLTEFKASPVNFPCAARSANHCLSLENSSLFNKSSTDADNFADLSCVRRSTPFAASSIHLLYSSLYSP